MIKKITRILISLLISILWILFVSAPCYAIDNPDDIAFGTGTTDTYNIYYDVASTADWLILAESFIDYTVLPTDYAANEAFVFQLLNEALDTVLASTPVNDYGDRPVSIYLTATQVTTLGLTVGTAYGLRITPNPALLGAEFEGTGAVEGTNQVTAVLTATDYIDQNLGIDSDPPTDNVLRDGIITMAEHMEANDTPADPYLIYVQGYQYLTNDGGDFFIEAIPSITTICPVAFQSGLEAMTSDPPESTGTYALTLTPAQKWGNTVANGLTNLGVYLGVNQALAGSAVLLVLGIMLAVFIYAKTQSGVSVLLIVATVPFVGSYLGLMPIALAFIFVIIVIVLLGYYFLSRGAL